MQLKRFKKKEENGITTVSKLTTKVNFQEELRLPCQLSSVGVTANYKVRAVIEHKGPTASMLATVTTSRMCEKGPNGQSGTTKQEGQ